MNSQEPTAVNLLDLLDGDTLLMDNSGLEQWTTCPRRGYYTNVRRLELANGVSPLRFGEAIHLALQCRFSLLHNKRITPIVEKRQMVVLEEYWKQWSTPIGDHRTLGLACKVIRDYNVAWPGEDDNLPRLFSDGIEIPFAVPLGQLKNGIKVIWKGKIDLVGHENTAGRDFLIVDHKTTSVGGEYALVEYPTSSQFNGYCYAISQAKETACNKVMVDLIVARKPAKKAGKGNEFIRRVFTYDDEQIEEWRLNTLQIIEGIIANQRVNFFPMHTKACVGRFGVCPFFSVCTQSPLSREHEIASGLYNISTWSPLHPSSPWFTAVMALPDDQLNPSEHIIENSLPMSGDILSSILGGSIE
jgi:hypothetical protein